LELLIKLEIDENAAGSPRLAAGAPWVRLLPRALSRIKHDPSSFSSVAIVIKAIYSGSDDATAPPDVSVSDFDDNFPGYILSMFVHTEWRDRVTDVNVLEQWQGGAKFRLIVEFFGMRQHPADDMEQPME
jgi:hypothetical protein